MKTISDRQDIADCRFAIADLKDPIARGLKLAIGNRQLEMSWVAESL
jgi:hypothetical protein